MKDFGYPPVFPDDTEGIVETKQEKTVDVDPINKRPKKVCTNFSVFCCHVYCCTGEEQSGCQGREHDVPMEHYETVGLER